MKNSIFLLAGLMMAGLLTSCDETIKLDLNQTESKVVIDGLITDQEGVQYVRITKTTDFYSTSPAPRIKNATVSVKDDANNTYTFIHNNTGKAEYDGVYFPETPFLGVAGRTYTLSVDVDGQHYGAVEKLNPVTPIDSITFKVNEDEKKDPKKQGKYYTMQIYAKEPKNTVDFYQFKFYRNDTLVYDTDSDVYIADDENISEDIDGVDGASYYGIGDTAMVQFYSLNRDAYLFYTDLTNLLQNSGGIFGSPPANCRTNLSNGALGFFQVSAVSSKKAKVVEP